MSESNLFSLNVRDSASGSLMLPGSKSISNRVILLSALCDKKVEIINFLESEDTEVMINCLKVLGVNFQKENNLKNSQYPHSKFSTLKIEGIGGKFNRIFRESRELKFFVGNSGLTIRTILPVLVAIFSQNSNCSSIEIDGVDRMRQRPIGDLVECLKKIGARITYLKNEGYAPILICPSKILPTDGIEIFTKDSSQFLTGMLQAAPLLRKFWDSPIVIKTGGIKFSRSYVDLTISVLKKFGVLVEEIEKDVFKVNSSKYIAPKKIIVEGDASSASYFLAAGMLGKGPICVQGVGGKSIQGDIKLAHVLKSMGANVKFRNHSIEVSGNNKLKGIDVDCADIPDAAMVLPLCALYAEGSTVLRNIASWRVKETDRINAIKEGIIQLGGRVSHGNDWMEINPPDKLSTTKIKTFNDHRIAMSFSLASFFHPGDNTDRSRKIFFDNPKCVEKTYPSFFDELARVCSQGVKVITIDGPTASGKGTISNRVGELLGFRILDSGCFYRVLALVSARLKILENDEMNLTKCAENLNIRFSNGRIFCGEEDISDMIRQESIGIRASKISVFQSVRKVLLRSQRDFARSPGLVADGRDMGSIVFPNAFLKVFLSADARIRAERRYKQLIQKEIPCKLNDLLQEIKKRDQRDNERQVGSLSLAREVCSIHIDTSLKSIEEVVQIIIDEFKLRSAL